MKNLCTVALATVSIASTAFTAHAQESDGSALEVPPVMLINNVHVWDGTSDSLKEDHDVLIVGDKIRTVAKGPKRVICTFDTSPATGCAGSGARVTATPVSVCIPTMAERSTGAGNHAATASSKGSTPMVR